MVYAITWVGCVRFEILSQHRKCDSDAPFVANCVISIPAEPESLLTVDCWLLTVDCWLWVKKIKIARIICCELDSTLRPTMKRGFDIMSGRFPPLRFARNQVGAGSPTISANNWQSQKPARPGYYGQSIGHDLIQHIPYMCSTKKPGFEQQNQFRV